MADKFPHTIVQCLTAIAQHHGLQVNPERLISEYALGAEEPGDLLLLRMADPDDRSDALPAFSIKQLMLQPFLAGGVVTVVAPLAVAGWGLPLWTGFCFALVLLFGGTGLWLARNQAPAP